MKEAVEYSQDRPVLIDHFLEDAIEVDVTRFPTAKTWPSPASCSTSRKPAFTRRSSCVADPHSRASAAKNA
jgi:hypothetical protein